MINHVRSFQHSGINPMKGKWFGLEFCATPVNIEMLLFDSILKVIETHGIFFNSANVQKEIRYYLFKVFKVSSFVKTLEGDL